MSYFPLSDSKKLKDLLSSIKSDNEELVIGFTCSSFDLLHVGHFIMLEDCKKHCDLLVVGLQSDPTLDEKYRLDTGGKQKNQPIQTLKERLIQIKGCRYVDYIIGYSTEKDLHGLLLDFNPDIRILGSDWKNKIYTGHDLSIKIYWHSRDHEYSTSSFRKKIYEQERDQVLKSKASLNEDSSDKC